MRAKKRKMWQKITPRALKTLQKHYERFEPFSDFNALSLWGYMSDGGRWLEVGDTILYELTDYHDNSRYLSVFGLKDSYRALQHAIDHVSVLDGTLVLRHVPKPTAQLLKGMPGITRVAKDASNNDYILSVDRLHKLQTPKLRKKAAGIQKLRDLHPSLETLVVDHTSEKIKKQVMRVFSIWVKQSKSQDWEIEHKALTNLLSLDAPSLVLVATYDGPKMIAFTVNEVEKNRYYQGHFGKANRNYPYLGTYIEHETAKIMHVAYHSRYMNLQQDLGLTGLSDYKRSWDPIRYLYKFVVELDVKSYDPTAVIGGGEQES